MIGKKRFPAASDGASQSKMSLCVLSPRNGDIVCAIIVTLRRLVFMFLLFVFFAFHSIEVATEFYTRTRDQCQSSVKLLSIERKSNVTLFGQMSNQTSTDNNFTFHQNNCSRRRFSQFLCKSNRNSCRRFFFTLCVCIRVYYDSQQETLTSQSK